MIQITCRNTGVVLLKVDAADLTGLDLSGVNLFAAHIVQQDLSGCDFSGANLFEANLSGSNLSKCMLTDANLSAACLVSTRFCDATMVSTALAHADLSNANLSGANLEGADLERAYLYRTNLTDCYIGRTRLRETIFTLCPTLHLARGLETAGKTQNGHGYTVLDLRTLRSCLPHLPDPFLINIGWSLEEIAALREAYCV